MKLRGEKEERSSSKERIERMRVWQRQSEKGTCYIVKRGNERGWTANDSCWQKGRRERLRTRNVHLSQLRHIHNH